MSIPFTQFMRPDGREKPVTVNRPSDVEILAGKVVEVGGRFTIEELMTGAVSVACEYDENDVACEIVPNGPQVPGAVDRVIRDAWFIITAITTVREEEG